MKLILLNGPSRSGKDTAAAAIAAHLLSNTDAAFVLERFSLPIKQAFAGMMDIGGILDNGIVPDWEKRKDEVDALLGNTYRNWQIAFSEHFMKPKFGTNIFGRLMLHRLHQLPDSTIVIIPDCGFEIEITTVAEAFAPRDVCLFNIYRHNCTFAGDNRRYVQLPRGYPHHEPLTNGTDKSYFESKAVAAARRFLEKTK
jgi:hypothetical protein